jgi:hypothetical protein
LHVVVAVYVKDDAFAAVARDRAVGPVEVPRPEAVA